jgi:glutathione S-transferase
VSVVLHQFLYSHYNEKARWALTWKGVAHERRSYLPGPHMPAIRRLSGQAQTPVLVWDGEVIAGSAAIIDTLEARVPERPLLPEDPDARAEVDALRRYFDDDVGPAVRTALFSAMIADGGYICRMFSEGKSPLVRGLYRATFPLARGLIARGNGVTDPANVERAFEISAQALDRVAERAGRSGQLVGEAFSAADLTAAALLAPLVNVDHPDMSRPRPLPEPVEAFLERWASHPGAAWVRDQYERFRPS